MSFNIEEARRKVRDFDEDIEQSKASLREYERFVFRYLALARRLGLPENVNQAIMRIHRLITVIRLLRVATTLLYATTGPIGYATAAAGVITGVLMAGDLMLEVNSG